MPTNHPIASRRAARLVAALAACAALLAGCGASGGDQATTRTTTTRAAKPSTTTTTTTEAAVTTTTVVARPTTTEAGGPVGAMTDVTWASDAQALRGKVGDRYDIDCPPNGVPSSIWGVETYTDDSSICTAAVQVGLITLPAGGPVQIQIAEGAKTYPAGVAHDIASMPYGQWPGSFTFPKAPPGSGTFDTSAAGWSRTAVDLGLDVGQTATVDCARGGQTAPVWGTGTYTGDSSICSAALLEGLITKAKGGKVAIAVSKGQDHYRGSTAHGFTSSDYGRFDLTFTFPAADQPGG